MPRKRIGALASWRTKTGAQYSRPKREYGHHLLGSADIPSLRLGANSHSKERRQENSGQLDDASETTGDVVIAICLLELAAGGITCAVRRRNPLHTKAAKSLDNTRNLGSTS